MQNARPNKTTQEGFEFCRLITKKYAKTFYFASLFLPPTRRKASYAVYAICRLADESADQADKTPQIDRIKNIETNISIAYSNMDIQDKILSAFRYTVNNFSIPQEYFETLIKGMLQDTEKKYYNNFQELHDYCYKVAGVVGLIMLKIFGCKNSKAQEYAVALGIAMQLTNILRDIKEDLLRDRIYLPKDELSSFGITIKEIENGTPGNNWGSFMQYQIKKAREYYAQSRQGLRFIDNRNSRIVITIMGRIYEGILDNIEHNGYNVFKKRARVNILIKIITALKVLIQNIWQK